MRIQNNITAMNTHRQYTINNDNVAKAAEKLSSGYRINRAGDDAAGLAISEKMRSQIRGLNMATKNSQDAISLVQTAEGALQETHSMLQRMNELAVQAATGTNEDIDRNALAKEFEQLKREINDVAEQTTFNNMKILDGSLSNTDGYVRSPATAGVTVTASEIDGDVVKGIGANGVIASKNTPIRGAFEVTLSGSPLVSNGSTGAFDITINGDTQTITSSAASGNKTTAADVAALFDGKKVTVDGVEYEAKATGAKLKFTATSDPAEDGSEDGAPVATFADAGTGGIGATFTAGTPVAAKGQNLSKESNTVTVSANALKVGDTITIDGKTFEVVEKAADVTAGNTAIVKDDNLTDATLITALSNGGYTNVTVADGGDGKSIKIEQNTAGTGATKVTYKTDSSATKYKSTIEFDTAKMKDGDKFKFSVGGKTTEEVEFKADTYKTDPSESAAEKFAADVAKALQAKGITVTQKGNAITYEGAKVTENDFTLTSITDVDTDTYKTNAMRIQVGALENEQLSIGIEAMNTKGLGLVGHNLDSQNTAGMAITAVRAAINKVSDQRATLGAMQNRLDHKIANLKVSSENLSAAESRIRDVDMASEMTNFTKNNILSQAATAMLAQANALPQNVLSLLG